MRNIILILILINISILNLFSQGWVEIFNDEENFQKDPYWINQIVVNSKNEIFLLCENFPTDKSSVLFKSSDQCKTWVSLKLPYHSYYDLYETPIRINSKDYLFIPSKTHIIMTTDGGNNYDTIFDFTVGEKLYGKDTMLKEILHLDISPNDDIYVSILWGIYNIIRSTDNGNNWEIICSSWDCDFIDLAFADDGSIWKAYRWGLEKSIDSCRSFTYGGGLEGSNVFYYPLSVAIGKDNVIFVMDEYNNIIKSVDGGEKFESSYFRSFAGSSWHGQIAANKNGFIFTPCAYSSDNGLTWNTDYKFRHYLTDSIFYATSSSCNIYKLDFTLLMDENINKKKILFISPNPTHNTTNIKYTINNFSNVYLVISSITGSIVKEFSLGEQSQGEHIFNIDTEDLPQGMYFIKLIAGEKVETGKLVVVE